VIPSNFTLSTTSISIVGEFSPNTNESTTSTAHVFILIDNGSAT